MGGLTPLRKGKDGKTGREGEEERESRKEEEESWYPHFCMKVTPLQMNFFKQKDNHQATYIAIRIYLWAKI